MENCPHCRRPHEPRCPSPAEIRQACFEIQEDWDDATERTRRGRPHDEEIEAVEMRVTKVSGARSCT